MPANSFIATAEAVSLAGATPAWSTSIPTHTCSPRTSSARRSARDTACVIPVHLYGRTVEMDPLLGLARRARARGRGGRLPGARRAATAAAASGRSATAGCFSFYPAKNLGAWGDGGAVVTDDPETRPPRAAAARARREPALPPPRRRHHLAARRHPSGGPAREAADGSTTGTSAVASARRADLAAAWPAPPCGLPRPPRRTATTSSTSSSSRPRPRRAARAPRGARRRERHPLPGADPPLGRLRRSSGLGTGSLPVAEGLAERICSLPMSPTLTSEEIDTNRAQR